MLVMRTLAQDLRAQVILAAETRTPGLAQAILARGSWVTWNLAAHLERLPQAFLTRGHITAMQRSLDLQARAGLAALLQQCMHTTPLVAITLLTLPLTQISTADSGLGRPKERDNFGLEGGLVWHEQIMKCIYCIFYSMCAP